MARVIEADPKTRVAEWLRRESGRCQQQGSPLYGAMLGRCADDVEREGPTWTVLKEHAGMRQGMILPLRLMGSVHRLVLEGKAPSLARFYPSVGGNSDQAAAWDALRQAFVDHAPELQELISRPIQTNEVGRSVALLGGFLLVAAETGLPLRLLEPGASAGLNLRWDRYRYECGENGWGDPRSPVRFTDAFTDRTPILSPMPRIAERRGCDIAPLDPSSPQDQLTLQSYVWADQTMRLERLGAALRLAQEIPVEVTSASAETWIARQLEEPAPEVATVIYHSIVMQYMEPSAREAFAGSVGDAGARATAKAPLAWLRSEPDGPDHAAVRLTTWPGGRERVLARSPFHGSPTTWLATEG
jgi:hypothetical protein